MTVFEWQANVIEGAGVLLAHTLSKTSEERLDWTPSADPQSQTRSALEQVSECIRANRFWTTLLRGETPGPPNHERPFGDSQEAQAQIIASAKELADVVRGLDEEVFTRQYSSPLGMISGALVLQIAAGNMTYHFGQINFIQMLYGDTEFHLPSRVSER